LLALAALWRTYLNKLIFRFEHEQNCKNAIKYVRSISLWQYRVTFITHAGCIAAGVGRSFSRGCLFICLSVCPSVCLSAFEKGKRLDLLIPNLVLAYSVAVARHALTQRSKGQGHTVTKTVMVARLLVTRAATAVAGLRLHVDTTVYVLCLLYFSHRIILAETYRRGSRNILISDQHIFDICTHAECCDRS